MTQEDLVEIFCSHDPGAIQQVLDVLDQAGIAHQLIGGGGGFDFTSIGSEGSEEKIINIRMTDHSAARIALEEDSLKADLPEDHHLLRSTDDELGEIITHSSEWSPFDVAHARDLLAKRGINAADLIEQQAARIARLEMGKPAPKRLMFFGWFFAILGGVIGIAIGLSLWKMKDKTPDGEFYRYNEASRATGKAIFKVGVKIALLALVIRFIF